jgi:hypothetical protein
MWKSGTRHVLMARAGYVARPIATSSTVTLSRSKKFTLTSFNSARRYFWQA